MQAWVLLQKSQLHLWAPLSLLILLETEVAALLIRVIYREMLFWHSTVVPQEQSAPAAVLGKQSSGSQGEKHLGLLNKAPHSAGLMSRGRQHSHHPQFLLAELKFLT